MKDVLGSATKGFGMLKGYIFGKSSSSKDTQNTSSTSKDTTENNNTQKENSKNTNDTQKEKNEKNIINKKGQFDFSEEDDEDDKQATVSTSFKNQDDSTTDINYEYSEPEENYWKIAHRVYLKNSMVDIEPLPYVPFIKVKKNDNLLSFIGFGNKKPFREIKYFAVFDEHFIYMINMTTKDNNQNNFFKKIGNHYDLTKVSNIEIKDDNVLQGKKLISLIFSLDDSNNSIIKELHFEKSDAIKFFAILKFYLKKYDVSLVFKDQIELNKKEEEKAEESKNEEEKTDEPKKEDEKKEEKKEEKTEDEKKEEKKEDEKKEEEKKEEKKEEEKKEEEKKEEKKEDEKKEEKKEEEKKEEEKKEEKKEEEKKEETKEEEKKEEEKEEKKEEKKENENNEKNEENKDDEKKEESKENVQVPENKPAEEKHVEGEEGQ